MVSFTFEKHCNFKNIQIITKEKLVLKKIFQHLSIEIWGKC